MSKRLANCYRSIINPPLNYHQTSAKRLLNYRKGLLNHCLGVPNDRQQASKVSIREFQTIASKLLDYRQGSTK